MKAVLYARVSSKEQSEEGFSLPSQVKLLKDYADKNNYKIVKKFIDVETAKKSGRENFNKMLDYIRKAPDIQGVLCEKTDRISRNFKDMAVIEELIEEKGYTFVFVKENNVISKHSQSQGKLMFYIMASMAKNYINNLSEETRKGLLEKAEQGDYPSSAPLGYKNIQTKSQGKTLRCLGVDEERAFFVEKLFKLYATGDFSLKALANNLYEEGLRTKKGNRLDKSTIHKILKNPFYYGYFTWNNKLYKGNHKPLITKELFDTVQEVFNRHNKPKYTKKKFAYSGLMVCGECGCAITAEIQKGKYVYYHCTGFKGKCNTGFVREEKLTEQFAEIIKKIQIDDNTLNLLKNSLKDSHRDEIDYHKKRIQYLNTHKTKLENRIHQIYVDKLDGKVSEKFYEESTTNWREELMQINTSIAQHENADSNYLEKGNQILELCKKAYNLYLEQEPLQNRTLLNTILSNCTLNGVSVCPTYRTPFHMFAEKRYRCPS